MDLAQGAPEVGVVVEGVVGDDEVDGAARREPEIGQLALVALDGHAGRRRRAAQLGDAIGVGVEGDRLGARLGQGDGVAGDAELDDPPAAADVAEQVQLVVARHVGAVGHVHGASVPPSAPDPGDRRLRAVVVAALASLRRP